MEIRPELFLTFRGHVGLGGIVELLGVSNTLFVGWGGRGGVARGHHTPDGVVQNPVQGFCERHMVEELDEVDEVSVLFAPLMFVAPEVIPHPGAIRSLRDRERRISILTIRGVKICMVRPSRHRFVAPSDEKLNEVDTAGVGDGVWRNGHVRYQYRERGCVAMRGLVRKVMPLRRSCRGVSAS